MVKGNRLKMVKQNRRSLVKLSGLSTQVRKSVYGLYQGWYPATCHSDEKELGGKEKEKG